MNVLSGRSSRRVLVSLLVAGLTVPILSAVTPTPAQAAGGVTELAHDSFGGIIVDSAHSHVFVAQNSQIAVLDLDGNMVTTIADQDGAGAMTIVDSTLYVTQRSGTGIARIDTATLTPLGRIASAVTNATQLVQAAGTLWTVSPGSSFYNSLVRVDPVTGATTEYPFPASIVGFATLTALPAEPNVLLAASDNADPVSFHRIDVSVDPPAELLFARDLSAAYLHSIAVAPDGQSIYVVQGLPHAVRQLTASTLTATGLTFDYGMYTNSVAVTASAGGRIAVGGSNSSGNDIVITSLNDPAAIQAQIDLGGPRRPFSKGLAFSPDGTRLFAVSLTGIGDVTFHVLPWGTIPAAGGYHSVTPARILDTRSALGAPAAPLGENGALSIQVAGAGGVPTDGAVAVVMNVTVVAPTSDSYLTVWPGGTERPTASNLNWVAGQTVPNLVTVGVGIGGRVQLYNASGEADVLADVVGWYDDGSARGARFNSITPRRLLDTRAVGPGLQKPSPFGPGEMRTLDVASDFGKPGPDMAAVVLNVTAADASDGGYLTVWPTGVDRPNASNLNFVPGHTVPNLVSVGVGSGGRISIFNAFGTTHVIVDIVGWYDASGMGGSLFRPLPPRRILDTRVVPPSLGPGRAGALTAAGRGGIPPTGATGVVMNVTVTNTTSTGFLTVWPADAPLPIASNLNWMQGQTIANLAIVRLPTDGRVAFFNAFGTTDVVGDVVGYFE
ncbi:MAG TPA: hypothetical protein VGQ20_01245 [Acidimicrobiales bacterium]|nr:hypothetical protein [Acidimicrobiales bacterium]